MRTIKALGPLALCLTAIVAPVTPAYAAAGPAVSNVSIVGQVTGPGDINFTPGWYDVWGTDLGITWDDGFGHVLSAYGDTFGAPFRPPTATTGPVGGNWRSNVLARSNDTRLYDGLSFNYMVTSGPGQPAKALLQGRQDPNGVGEVTIIPTAGVSVNGRQYMHYMSVREWGAHGVWRTNYSGIAYSDDWGNTWRKDAVTWQNPAGNNKFQMAAFVRRSGYVYMFGTPNGRLGSGYVARVPEASVLTKSAYQYWNGSAWVTGADTQAAQIVPATVGENSVQFNAYLNKWLMMYTDHNRGGIVLRQADAPQGPWSDPTMVASGADYPGIYGSYMHPWSSGPDVYFQISRWPYYNVYQMRLKLGSGGDPVNAVRNGGFEGPAGHWNCTGNCGVDRGAGFAYSESNNAWVRHNSGWDDVWQEVTVQANRNYQLTGWVRTSPNSDNGFFGVRTTAGSVVAERNFRRLDAYTLLTVNFNSGANTKLRVFGGVWTNNGDIWMQMDQVTLLPV